MLYEHAVTVPANTPASSPHEELITLVPGTIVGVALQFPAGCVGLVHAQIWEANHQVWPSNPGASVAGDAALIQWQEEYDLDADPYQLILRAWNLDDTWDHTVTFRLNLIEQRRIEEGGTMGVLGRIAKALGVR